VHEELGGGGLNGTPRARRRHRRRRTAQWGLCTSVRCRFWGGGACSGAGACRSMLARGRQRLRHRVRRGRGQGPGWDPVGLRFDERCARGAIIPWV
jgi:hypothetical protein